MTFTGRTRTLLILLAGCIFASSLCSGAEYPELITDRPDQTESSTTVPYQSVQIETGWLHSEEDDDDIETDTFPQTLLRYGLADGLELRLNYDGYVWENAVGLTAGAVDNEGSGDTAVGF